MPNKAAIVTRGQATSTISTETLNKGEPLTFEEIDSTLINLRDQSIAISDGSTTTDIESGETITFSGATVSGNTVTIAAGASATGLTFVGDDSTGTLIADGETIKVAGTQNITTAMSGDTLTITGPDLSSYITASSTDTLTNKSGNISQWTNDSGYLTSFTETNDLTSAVTWANVPDANITQSSVTQHQAALSITESQISDLGSYITDVVSDTTPQLGGDLDVNGNAITGSTVSIEGATGELMITATENGPVALRYDNNLKLTTKSDGVDITGELQADSLDIDGNADITGTLNTHTIPSGTGTIALTSDIPTNNTELTNGAGYITASSTDTLTNKSGNISQWTNDSGYLTSFTETNDLTSAVTWANVPDANITQSSVTQHQAALSITESQISDLQSYITDANITIVGDDSTGTSFSAKDNDNIKITGTQNTAVSVSGDTITVTGPDLSSYATTSYVDTELAGLVDSAPEALNTLNELAAALGDDANFATTTSTALGNRLRVDTAAQGLTGTQQSNARTNLGLATVASTGAYSDLSGLPTIPTNNNQLTNGAGYITDYTVTEADVTQHQAALSITESQISDLGSYITATSTDTLTNKTFDANGTGNSITNIEVADFASGVIDTDISTVSGSDDTLASAKAIKTYVDAQIGTATTLTTDGLTITDNNITGTRSNEDINVTASGTGQIVLNNNTTVDGTMTATQFEGDLNGAILLAARNQSGGTIYKGQAVYVNGLSGDTPTIILADASDPAKMPALGVAKADINNNATDEIVTLGNLYAIDTSASNQVETGVTLAVGDVLYISATQPGKLTNVAPAGESNQIQNIGRVVRVSPNTNMTFKIHGAGRSNATPALDDGNIFIGNASNQTSTVALSDQIKNYKAITVVGDDSTGTDVNIGETFKVAGTQNVTTAVSGDTLTITGPDLTSYLTAETNDLTSAVTWANVPDANITQSSVTQHQAALSITESQISDLGSYITATSTDTLTNKTFDANGTGNSLSNVEVADLAASSVVTAAEGIASNNNDTTIPTSAAVKAYADSVGGTTLGDLTAVGSTLQSPSNADLTLDPGGTGRVNINGAFRLPNTDGAANQIMATDGAGVISFVDPTAINIDGGTADSIYTSVPTIDGGTA
jgi:hypothetical protein